MIRMNHPVLYLRDVPKYISPLDIRTNVHFHIIIREVVKRDYRNFEVMFTDRINLQELASRKKDVMKLYQGMTV